MDQASVLHVSKVGSDSKNIDIFRILHPYHSVIKIKFKFKLNSEKYYERVWYGQTVLFKITHFLKKRSHVYHEYLAYNNEQIKKTK